MIKRLKEVLKHIPNFILLVGAILSIALTLTPVAIISIITYIVFDYNLMGEYFRWYAVILDDIVDQID